MKTLLSRRDQNIGRHRRSAITSVANSRCDRGAVGPHDRARAIPADLGIACAELPRPRMVPRRQVRHLGALVGPMRAGAGDWYARRMYQQDDSVYDYHVKTYGHPSKFGFMEIDNLWKAERWEPEKLMALYKRAGAKYFFALCQPPRQLRRLRFELSRLELGQRRPEKGHRRHVGQSRACERAALRRQQPLGSRMALVSGGLRVRCGGAARRHALRRRAADEGRW